MYQSATTRRSLSWAYFLFIGLIFLLLSTRTEAQRYVYERTIGSPGSGTGQLSHPNGIAIDSKGNILVCDTGNNRILRFDNVGNYLGKFVNIDPYNVSTPARIAVDGNDNIFVTFTELNSLLFTGSGYFVKLDKSGNNRGQFGGYGGYHETFRGIATDRSGNVYVTAGGSGVWKYDNTGKYICNFSNILDAYGIAIDTIGNMFVTPSNGNIAHKYDRNGNYFSQIQIWNSLLGAVAIDNNDNLYIGSGNILCKYDNNGNYLSQMSGGRTIPNYAGVAVDSSGSVYGVDTSSNCILKYRPINLTNQPDKACGNPYDNSGACEVGEPINVGTGNVYDEVTDYETAGANKLRFVRYYNSRVNANAAVASLGRNWRSNYDRKIVIASNTSVAVIRADGQGLQFTWNGSAWISDSDVGVRLTQSNTTWTLTDTDDTVEIYSPIGSAPIGFINQPFLKSIQARNGYTQTLQYDGSKQLASVTDSYGRMLNFTFQSGLLQTVITPDGLVLIYNYGFSIISQGNDDRLASVSYATTHYSITVPPKQSYQYANATLPNALTAIIDENGNAFASWTYDQYGRGLTSQFGTGALLTTVAYNDNDGSRKVTNSLGLQETYRFATMQGVPKVTEIDRPAATKTFTYDGNGYLASESDWNGNVTTYANDAMGRPTTIIEAAYTSAARTTTISYVTNFHLAKHIVAPQITTDYTYDAFGNALTKTLTDTTTTLIPYKTNGQTRKWMYTWSATGLLTSIQNPRTDVSAVTFFTYDNSGCLIKTTNALGQSVQVTQHSPGGLPLTVVDANNVMTQFSYDARLRLLGTAVTTLAGVLKTLYTYDPAGNLLTTTLPDGSALANKYDTAHRLTGVMNLFNQVIAYTLDAAGNRTVVSILGGAGVVRQQRNNTFDALSRLTMVQGGAGQKTTYAYDRNSNLLSVTNPLGHTSAYGYDAFSRRIQTTNAANGVTEMDYNALDHPLSVTDPNKANTTYVYNGFGDVIQKTSPDSGVTVYTYDADGNLIGKTDAVGITVSYTYDKLDRVATAKYSANASENVAYTYDQSGYGFGVGRLTAVTDAVGTLSRAYDERGNVTVETRVIGTATLRTSYAYDAAGRVIKITYPSGTLVTYGRDIMGHTITISAQAPGATVQTVVSNVTYQPFGPVNGLLFGNNIAETRSFDNDYRLTQILTKGAATLQNLTYGYDGGDNVLSITDSVAPKNSQSFSYGTLERLIQATGSYGSLTYGYDSVGNRLTQNVGGTVTNYAYASSANRLASFTSGGVTQTVSYTKAGNTSVPGPNSGLSLSYNQAGRLASVTAGGKTTAQYGYDAFGKRLTKSTATKTLFQYDLQNHLLEEIGSAANTTTDYIYLEDGRLIATVSPSAKSVYYVHCDRLGTPQLATNSVQTVVWSTAYTPYGQTGTVNSSITQNLRLPGQYFDSETGWNQNGFRDYVPSLGRYLETDPIGLDGGLNTYAYVNANPINAIDLNGLRVNQQYIPLSWNNQKLYSYGWTYNEPGVYTIEGHGDPSNFLGNGSENISPQDLAKTIFNDPDYTPGMPVRLLSCNTGVGENSYAQQLTTALANLTSATGRLPVASSVVYAPDGYVVVPWSYSFLELFSGVFSEEPASIIKMDGQPGGWQTFKP